MITSGFQLDKRREAKRGYPVKLRITYQRQSRLYATDLHLDQKDFDKLNSTPNPRGRLKDIRIKLNAIQTKADDIILELGDEFTFDKFKNNLTKKPSSDHLLGLLQEYIAELREEGRIGSARSYGNALKSFETYLGNRKVDFKSITPEWLKRYQDYMVKKGRSLTTIGIYLRSLRTVYNIAIERKLVSQEDYPFSKRRFQIPAPRNIKKALSKDELKKIFEFDPSKDTWEEKAHDYWMFSYLCNGANPKDMFQLRPMDMDEECIYFIRDKTKRTSVQNLKTISAARTIKLNEILERRKAPEGAKYVFPVLDGSEDLEEADKKMRLAIIACNKWLKRIAAKLEITANITFMTARHSYATMLKRGNAPTEFIQESLGHKSKSTTESYLDSFEDDTRKQYAELLTKFD